MKFKEEMRKEKVYKNSSQFKRRRANIDVDTGLSYEVR